MSIGLLAILLDGLQVIEYICLIKSNFIYKHSTYMNAAQSALQVKNIPSSQPSHFPNVYKQCNSHSTTNSHTHHPPPLVLTLNTHTCIHENAVYIFFKTSLKIKNKHFKVFNPKLRNNIPILISIEFILNVFTLQTLTPQ